MNDFDKEEVFSMIFPPSARSMKEDYPELSGVKEFEQCTAPELKFAWYYSVFYRNERSEKKRLGMAYSNSFLRGNKTSYLTDKERENYEAGDIPPHVRTAIQRFGSYDVNARFLAKLGAERALATLLKFVDYDEDEFDAEKRKKYTDTIIPIIKELPAIIAQVETGYGLKEVKMSRRSYARPDVDSWHEQNK